jgi:hypothetical protein
MATGKEQLTVVKKEMGITHKDFYGEIPNLLGDIPYHQSDSTITFQYKGKKIEITLDQEGVREVTRSMHLPVTMVTLHFLDFTEEEQNVFIRHFNLKFMRGGG